MPTLRYATFFTRAGINKDSLKELVETCKTGKTSRSTCTPKSQMPHFRTINTPIGGKSDHRISQQGRREHVRKRRRNSGGACWNVRCLGQTKSFQFGEQGFPRAVSNGVAPSAKS